MLSSQEPLVPIALECRMCDQARFSRVFRRIVGINPRALLKVQDPKPAPASNAR
jgi:AraC-like DNA-binding protein